MGEQFDPPLQRRSESPKEDVKDVVKWFSVLPNPADDLVRIIWDDKMDLNKVRYLIVTNLLGQRIRSFSIPEGEQVSSCDVSHIPPGMYVLSTDDGTGRVYSELIIIR